MNDIPLNLYIIMNIFALLLFVFMFVHTENIVRIIVAFISTLLSYVNALLIVSGNVVSYIPNNTGYTTVYTQSDTMNLIWTFLAIASLIMLILFILDEINSRMESELSEEEAESI